MKLDVRGHPPAASLLVALLLALPLSATAQDVRQAAAPPAIAALLPPGTLFHLQVDGMKIASTADHLGLVKIFREPEVRGFLGHLLRYVGTGRAMVEANLEFMIDGPASEAYDLLKRRITLSLAGVQESRREVDGMQWTETIPDLLFTWDVSGHEKAARNLLASAERMLAEETGTKGVPATIGEFEGRRFSSRGEVDVYVFLHGGRLLMGTGRATLARVLEGLGGKVPADGGLAARPSFARARTRVLDDDSVVFFYAALDSVMELAAAEAPEQALAVMKAAGANGMGGIGYGARFSGGAVVEKIHIALEPGSPLMKLKPRSPGVRAHEMVPAETGFLYALRFSPSGWFDYLKGLMEAVGPPLDREFADVLARIENASGGDFEQDILPLLGEEAAFAAWWPGQALVPDLALILDVTDADGLESRLTDFMQRFEGSLRGGSFDFMGHRIHHLGPRRMKEIRELGFRPQVRITWAVISGRLVITPWPQAMKNLIAGMSGGEEHPRLADLPRFKTALAAVRKDHPGLGSSAIIWADTGHLAGFVMDNAAPLVQSLVPDDLGIPVRLQWALWPSTESVTRHLPGFLGAVTWEKDGVLAEYRSTLGLLPMEALAMTAIGVAKWMELEEMEVGPAPQRADGDDGRKGR